MWETWVQCLGWNYPPRVGHGSPLQCSCLENRHGQNKLVGYSPCGHEEDTPKRVSTAHNKRMIKSENNGTRYIIPAFWKKAWLSVLLSSKLCFFRDRGGYFIMKCQFSKSRSNFLMQLIKKRKREHIYQY